MSVFNRLSLLSLSLLLFSCGSDPDEETSPFSLSFAEGKNEYQLNEKIIAEVSGAGSDVDSIIYYLGEQRLEKINSAMPLEYVFQEEKLGKWDFTAEIYTNGEVEEISEEVILYNDEPPVTYTYEVINKYPHATDAYTQGLEFYEGELYESTGQYGESTLRKVDLETGEVLQSAEIPDEFFAEGITILDDKIYLLTWQDKMGFIYDVNTFEKIGEFAYAASEEGWGLTNDGEKIYKSDGTEKIWILNRETLAEEDFVQTVTHRTVATQLNELEWVEGKIYANTYQKDGVAIINPENGAIEGLINFQGLRDQVGNVDDLDPVNDVLNGIAYNPETKKLFVTGKDWDTLFEVKIVEE